MLVKAIALGNFPVWAESFHQGQEDKLLQDKMWSECYRKQISRRWENTLDQMPVDGLKPCETKK
jgi:hypothetical protein